MTVKEFLKLVDIWWRYKQKFGGMFFWLTVYIWPPKPEVVISLELWQIASKFQRQIRDFRWLRARLIAKWFRQRTTTRNCRLGPETSMFSFPVVGLVAISFGVSFFELAVAKIQQLPLWANCHPICHSSRDISNTGFGGRYSISSCRTLSKPLEAL